MNTLRAFLYVASIHSIVYATLQLLLTVYPSMTCFYACHLVRTLIFVLTMRKFSRIVFSEPYFYVAMVNCFLACASNVFFLLCDPEVDDEPFLSLFPVQWATFAEVITLNINHLLLPCLVCQYVREQRDVLAKLTRVRVTDIDDARVRYVAVEAFAWDHNRQWTLAALVWLLGIAVTACLELGTFITWLHTEYVTRIEIISTIMNQITNLVFIETITRMGDRVDNSMKFLRRCVMKRWLCPNRIRWHPGAWCGGVYDHNTFHVREPFHRADVQLVTEFAAYLQLSSELSERSIEFSFHDIVKFRRSLTFSVLVTFITYSIVVFQLPSIVVEGEGGSNDDSIRDSSFCRVLGPWLN